MIKKPITFVLFATAIFLSGCAYQQPITYQMERDGMMWCKGNEFTFIGGNECLIGTKKNDFEIISDIEISELRIRVSRTKPSYFKCDSGHSEIVELVGPFNAFTSDVISKTFSTLSECYVQGSHIKNVVHLTSDGGRLIDGIKVGELIREKGFRTYIPNDGMCASSCAVAFLGGKYRTINGTGRVLVHAPYIRNTYDTSTYELYKTMRSEIVCAGDLDQLREYFVEMIGKEDGEFIYQQSMNYCSESSGWDFNKEAAALYNIDNTKELLESDYYKKRNARLSDKQIK